jgi:hypothetical protein
MSAAMFGHVFSAEGPDAAARLVGERPDPPGTATMVTVGIFLADIDEIDDAQQRYTADLFLKIAWKDPRLALPEDEQSGQNRSLPLDEIWSPRGVIVNDRGMSPQLPRVANVDAQGNVTYRQRVWGQLAADLEFKEFPFDSQRLPVDIAFYQYSPDEMSFSPDSGMLGDEASFSAEGWRFRILEPTIGEFSIASQGIVRPRLTFLIEARRDSKYYMLTMVLPMSLIVFMAWTAFWLQPSIINPRLGISTAAIFSLIALGVSIRLGLPPISYLTRADLFVIGCTVLVFMALGVAVTVIRWASGDRMDQALRLNRTARWIYPVVFGVIFTVAIVL